MASTTEDYYPIPGLNACLPRKAIMCFEKSMKGYVGLTKPKTPLSEKLYYKATTGLVCRRTPFNSSKNALNANSLLA